MAEDRLEELVSFLRRVPGIHPSIGFGAGEDGRWWVKFVLDIEHPLAWNVVQEMGHVLNYLNLDDRLPTAFMPVSPPPYMNGGPKDFLSWIIECHNPEFEPKVCAEWLEGRLPDPVDDLASWAVED